MRKLTFILLGLALYSCNDNQISNKYDNTTKEESQVSNLETKHAESTVEYINIDDDFEPTLKLTNEIRNTSLRDFILQEKGRYTDKELKKNRKMYNELYNNANPDLREFLKKLSPEREPDMVLIRSLCYTPQDSRPYGPNDKFAVKKTTAIVPDTSNLAKVYYLQDMGGFARNNREYFDRISQKALEKRMGPSKKKKNWDEYM